MRQSFVLSALLSCACTYIFIKKCVFEKTNKKNSGKISRRCAVAISHFPYYIKDFVNSLSNAYNSETNQNGVITLCVAQNVLNWQQLKTKLSTTTPFEASYVSEYNDMRGLTRFRIALAKYFSKNVLKGVAINAHNITVTTGAASALESLTFALCDANDAVLIPKPFYSAFYTDFTARTGCSVIEIKTNADDNYEITAANLEASLSRCEQLGLQPRMIVLTNPNNPLGTVHNKEYIVNTINLSKSHGLNIIVDEIYACCLYKDEAKNQFVSAASLTEVTNNGDLHIIWGLSKDFGISGFRIGVLFTLNEDVLSFMSCIGGTTAVSNPIQLQMAEVFEDGDFCGDFIKNSNDLLAHHSLEVCTFLKRYNISFVTPSAGMFIWLDLRKFLKTPTSWASERELYERFVENKLIIAPGEAFASPVAGFFRICFASLDHATLCKGLERLSVYD